MATSLQQVYDSFLSKIEADDWTLQSLEDGFGECSSEVKADWRMLLDAAIVEFRYPRVSLEHDEYEFTAELTNDEIQVLSSLMRLGWIRRCISTWDNVRHLWSDKDYSPANFLQRLTELETVIEKDSRRLKDWYGRSHQYKPDPIFGRLAGK